jgi:hypothetical protein
MSRSDYSATYPTVVSLPGEPAVPETPATSDAVSVIDLVESGLLPVGTILIPTRESVDALGEIDEQGQIVVNDETFDSPSGAARAAAGRGLNGWTFWQADTAKGLRRLDAIREEYRLGNVELADGSVDE